MAVNIDVFSNNSGQSELSAGADYSIFVKWGKRYDETSGRNLPYFVMNVNKVLQSNHYAVLMRYKQRAHNGSAMDARPKMNKWFAFYYSRSTAEEHGGFRTYATGSIIKAIPVNYETVGGVDVTKNMPATDGYYSYNLTGVLPNGSYADFRYALLSRFCRVVDNQFLIITLDTNKRTDLYPYNGDWQDPSEFYDNIYNHVRCFYNCGIGIVDNQGTLLSNIVPLKILIRTAYVAVNDNEVVCGEIADLHEMADFMLIYPQVKQRQRS